MSDSSRRRGTDRRDLSLARVVQAIKPRAVRFMVWDTTMPGFGVDVWPSGVRSWIFFYRVLGTQRRVKLGALDRMTHDEARRKARAFQSAVDAERDPFLERKEREQGAVAAERKRKGAATFADVAERYLATLEAKKSARWAKEARRILEKDILPTLGALPVADVTATAVRSLHESMRKRPILANRAKAIVSGVLARAIDDGDRPVDRGNAAHAIEQYAEAERDRIITGAEWVRLRHAFPALRDELADVPAWDTRSTQVRAIELIALTGARVNAITPRRVGDLNLEAGVLRIAPAHKYVSRLFLGSAARRLVESWALDADEPRSYLFPGQVRRVGARTARGTSDARPQRAPAPVGGLAKAWARLLALAKIEDLTPHDLRRTFGSVGAELGYSTFVIGGLLGHRAQGVTERHYTQRPDPMLLAAADAISEEMAKRLGLAPVAPSAKVLPMRAKRRARA